MIRAAMLVPVALLSCATAARAQSLTGEVDVTVGASSDETSASAVQARVFGATRSDWRFYVEGSWARTVSDYTSDAFATSYPYDGRVRPMEIFGEKTVHPGRWLLGTRLGRFRTPFGIGGRSDHAYSGFLRAPLVRYGTNFALSNTFLEAGADLIAGLPSLYVETSLGVPQDEGRDRRARGLDSVVRVQGYYRDVILGASYLRSKPSDPRPFVRGSMRFRGLDGRWMLDGVELRGEWIDGHPFDGVVTRGGYLDAIVHRPSMGPVTAVARIERVDYDAGPFSFDLRRLTMGARVRLASWLVGQANLVRQPGGLSEQRDHAVDVAFTVSRRF